MSKLDFNTVLAISIHDMKNSLNLLLGSLDDLLQREEQRPSMDSDRLALLRYEARRVNDTLIQLLALYRSVKGLYHPYFTPVSIHDLLEEYWLNNKILMDHRNVECHLTCDEDLVWVLDRYLVNSLLENVVNNTVRYTRSRIHMSARSDGDWLLVQVADDGPGFPRSMLGRQAIREGVQLDPQRGRTGLGLYFCALVADMHGGNGDRGFVELSNGCELGGGCFTLHLPKLPLN
ncbi:sensor histidine kinase [Ectothiorhodospira lacustris]|uniref:sensor histidine kinase n=1 Tax=Ectothiorhodospira lacustris TaxID=2899127 RepID=UPI001EE8BADA|nr:HAMP domain-containing sensor histidine kinase [Ectothiorhodospira lacustris]MCG5499850.1 HAMP domain-containing histidine kinase [Ectothiorhodospira lacustris]MCG5508998.1 HAMP domain-containing histidine kinase [Ectothiorhodospira lacustris]MCG5520789.1 HAMP domain-containing histidine kinase [Ectothiorhodospira lacustris]